MLTAPFDSLPCCKSGSIYYPSLITLQGISGLFAKPLHARSLVKTHAERFERRLSIFLAARTVFVDSTAQIRCMAAIKAVISDHPGLFQPLRQKYGFAVSNIIYHLLQSGVFESERKAKAEFPGLYQTSPDEHLQHDASEQQSAQSEESEESEAEAFNEPSSSDLGIFERDPSRPRIGVAGCN